jgi:hypothetical protein
MLTNRMNLSQLDRPALNETVIDVGKSVVMLKQFLLSIIHHLKTELCCIEVLSNGVVYRVVDAAIKESILLDQPQTGLTH